MVIHLSLPDSNNCMAVKVSRVLCGLLTFYKKLGNAFKLLPFRLRLLFKYTTLLCLLESAGNIGAKILAVFQVNMKTPDLQSRTDLYEVGRLFESTSNTTRHKIDPSFITPFSEPFSKSISILMYFLHLKVPNIWQYLTYFDKTSIGDENWFLWENDKPKKSVNKVSKHFEIHEESSVSTIGSDHLYAVSIQRLHFFESA